MSWSSGWWGPALDSAKPDSDRLPSVPLFVYFDDGA